MFLLQYSPSSSSYGIVEERCFPHATTLIHPSQQRVLVRKQVNQKQTGTEQRTNKSRSIGLAPASLVKISFSPPPSRGWPLAVSSPPVSESLPTLRKNPYLVNLHLFNSLSLFFFATCRMTHTTGRNEVSAPLEKQSPFSSLGGRRAFSSLLSLRHSLIAVAAFFLFASVYSLLIDLFPTLAFFRPPTLPSFLSGFASKLRGALGGGPLTVSSPPFSESLPTLRKNPYLGNLRLFNSLSLFSSLLLE